MSKLSELKVKENGYNSATIVPIYLTRKIDDEPLLIMQGFISKIDGYMVGVWQTKTPSFVMHFSIESAEKVHCSTTDSEFVSIYNDSLKEGELLSYFGSPFILIHDKKTELTRQGEVAKGILCNNNWVIMRWSVSPYSFVCFPSWESFTEIHVSDDSRVGSRVERFELSNYRPDLLKTAK